LKSSSKTRIEYELKAFVIFTENADGSAMPFGTILARWRVSENPTKPSQNWSGS
jgi:hypothetical protein